MCEQHLWPVLFIHCWYSDYRLVVAALAEDKFLVVDLYAKWKGVFSLIVAQNKLLLPPTTTVCLRQRRWLTNKGTGAFFPYETDCSHKVVCFPRILDFYNLIYDNENSVLNITELRKQVFENGCVDDDKHIRSIVWKVTLALKLVISKLVYFPTVTAWISTTRHLALEQVSSGKARTIHWLRERFDWWRGKICLHSRWSCLWHSIGLEIGNWILTFSFSFSH